MKESAGLELSPSNRTMFDTSEAMYRQVMAKEVGLKRQAQDMRAQTKDEQTVVFDTSKAVYRKL